MIFRAGLFFFFFNDTATTEIYTLSLHDALPISSVCLLLLVAAGILRRRRVACRVCFCLAGATKQKRSEEHTSELQSRLHLVCRLLLEKKIMLTSIDGGIEIVGKANPTPDSMLAA